MRDELAPSHACSKAQETVLHRIESTLVGVKIGIEIIAALQRPMSLWVNSAVLMGAVTSGPPRLTDHIEPNRTSQLGQQPTSAQRTVRSASQS
ncbi:hypothetical protein C7G42_29515 [Bradyrhizobium sp. MOS003]|nr:hypothetical protein C7G42_29515 [Bradyrhizobium sp. MOS003]